MSGFASRLDDFGIRRVIFSWDTYLAVIILFAAIFNYVNMPSMNDKFLEVILNISATLGALVLGGFAIVVALTDNDFIKFLRKAKVYENIIFFFEYNIIISLFCLLIAFISRFIFFSEIMLFALFFLFPYLILSIIRLVSLISIYGIKRAEFIELKG